ncbi:MAG: DUF2179 domain-containing protein [Faecalibacterium sp.]
MAGEAICHSARRVLLCMVSSRELPCVERGVKSSHPECFLVVSRITEVSGQGACVRKAIR